MSRPLRKSGQGQKREELRARMFEQQNGLCHICRKPMTLQRKNGSKVGRLFATFDHIRPTAKGGTAHRLNLKLAHRACNNARNDRAVQTVDESHD